MIKIRPERILRRIFPSISRLTFNPVVKLIGHIFDFPLRYIYREFQYLPPNYMRTRVGVGNRFINNQIHYLNAAKNFWLYVFSVYQISLDSKIVDLGCGCGRYAHHMRDYWAAGSFFSGEYVGVDIDSDMIGWCGKHFDNRFRFHLSTDPSSSYNRDVLKSEIYKIPEPDSAFDIVFSASLFTHLLEEQLKNYLRETYRLLKPGGIGHHSFFFVDFKPITYGSRHTFTYRVGNAYVESLYQPEAAVAYESVYILDIASTIGFSEARILKGEIQSILFLRK